MATRIRLTSNQPPQERTMTDEALRVAALKVVSEYTRELYNEARTDLAEAMTPGDRLTARSPLDNRKIGSITYTDPKTTARISDLATFSEWVAKHYPQQVEHDFEIIGSHQEVVAALFESAPNLLRRTTKIDDDLVRQVRTDSATIGAPVGPSGEADVPGVVVETPAPVVSCRPTPEALAAVIDLFRAEQITLDSLAAPELPGGAA